MSTPPETATDVDGTDPTEWVGRVVDGRYRIDGVLGQGGMGMVFVAEHIALRKNVALKLIQPRHAGDRELAQRFAREAMVSAKLEHPHVASALDSGSLPDGSAYLVMQLARGRSLHAWMHGRGDWRIAAQVGLQIADALATAHARGIVHRDLKPENVIVEEVEGGLHARVLDFGIARVLDASKDGTPLTRLGTIMGTVGYMAPEQAIGDPVDARADVYSLGVILWEIATGQTLLERAELGAMIAAQLTMIAPRIATAAPDVPPQLDALVARMLESSKAKRPANGAEVRDALRTVTLLDAARTSMPAPPAAQAREPSVDATHLAHAAPSVVGAPSVGTVAPYAPTEIARPAARVPRAPRGAIAGAIGAGAIAMVMLSCIAMRTSCSSASTDAAGATALAPGAPSPPFPPVTSTIDPMAGAAMPLDGIPAELTPDVAILAASPDEATRSGAASRLLPREGELPAHVRILLAYETGEDCDDRRDAIRALRVLGEPGVLPALRRIEASDRRSDRCLRRDLDRAIEELTRRRGAPTR